jgi:hypothetical protein
MKKYKVPIGIWRATIRNIAQYDIIWYIMLLRGFGMYCTMHNYK